MCRVTPQIIHQLGRRIDLGSAIGGRDLFPGNQPVTVIHEDMTQIGETGGFSGTFLVEPGIGIGHRSVGIIATRLPAEIGAVTASVFRVFGLKGFLRGSGFQKCPVHREVFL